MHGIAHHELVALGHGPFHVALLHQADVFLAGTDSHLHAIDHDLLGGRGNRHQARGALAVQGLAADAVGQAAGEGRHAPLIPPGGAASHGGAHDQVVDFTGFDPGADHRGTDGVAGHARRLEVVEGTAKGFGDGRTGGGEDDGFFHGQCPIKVVGRCHGNGCARISVW
ncbi:hypothetical protein D3C87_1599620 [compost metagenome]